MSIHINFVYPIICNKKISFQKTYLYHKGNVWYFGDEGDGQKKGIH